MNFNNNNELQEEQEIKAFKIIVSKHFSTGKILEDKYINQRNVFENRLLDKIHSSEQVYRFNVFQLLNIKLIALGSTAFLVVIFAAFLLMQPLRDQLFTNEINNTANINTINNDALASHQDATLTSLEETNNSIQQDQADFSSFTADLSSLQ